MFDGIIKYSVHGEGNPLCDVYTEDCVWHHDNINKAGFNIYGLASIGFMVVPVIFGCLFGQGEINAWIN